MNRFVKSAREQKETAKGRLSSPAEIISARQVVLDEMKKGRRGDKLGSSVLRAINTCRQNGINVDWSSDPARMPHPFWYEGFNRNERGKKLSRKETSGLLKRRVIQAYEEELEKSGHPYFEPINPFEEKTSSIDVPLGTSKTLDSQSGWNVTAAQKILRTSPDKLLRDLIPMHKRLAKKLSSFPGLGVAWYDDLIQEAQLRIWTKLHFYDGKASFKTWAWRVSENAMINYAVSITRKRRRDVLGALESEESPGTPGTPGTPDFAPMADLRLSLATVMPSVPNADLLLYQAYGYEDSEINRSFPAMRRLRAKQKIRELLGGDDLSVSA